METTWQRAQTLLSTSMNRVPRRARHDIGPYRLVESDHVGFVFQSNGGTENVYTTVSMSSGARWAAENVRSVGTRLSRTPYLFRALEARSIRQPAALGSSEYPTFEYEWSFDGNLTYLRVNVSATTFATYHTSGPSMTGEPELLAKLPQTLSPDVKEILGVAVPHMIDYEAMAAEILQRSQLEAFLKLV